MEKIHRRKKSIKIQDPYIKSKDSATILMIASILLNLAYQVVGPQEIQTINRVLDVTCSYIDTIKNCISYVTVIISIVEACKELNDTLKG